MSQAELSKLSGISIRTISNLEHDRNVASYKTRRTLLKALHIPWEQHSAIFGYMK